MSLWWWLREGNVWLWPQSLLKKVYFNFLLRFVISITLIKKSRKIYYYYGCSRSSTEVIIYCLRLMQHHWSSSLIFVWLSPWPATKAPPREEPCVFPCEGSNKQHPPSPTWSYEPCKMTTINNPQHQPESRLQDLCSLPIFSGWKDFCYAKSIAPSFPFTPTKIFSPRMTKCRNAKNVPEDKFIPTFLLLLYEVDSK